MSLSLRPYQSIIVDKVRERMKAGVRSILITSPCGSGKTILTAFILKRAAEKGISSLFLVHRRELIKQSVMAFGKAGVTHGVIANNFQEDRRHLIQIASVQTLSRRLDKIKTPKLVIYDESHHLASASWSKIHSKFSDSFHIGLSGTPERLDGKGLGDYFDEIVYGPSVKWLIENKYLSPYKLYAPSSVNTSKMHMQMGDYKKSELVAAVDKPTITGDSIKHYLKLAAGKRAIVFCVSIEHSKHVSSQFQAAGIPSAHIDGDTPIEERDAIMLKFQRGDIRVLCNVDICGEGLDIPAIEVAILLRPTASMSLFIQQTGRALRISEGKQTAIILDHCGNTMKHGLPDEEREWSLEGRQASKKGKEEKTASVKICGACFAAIKAGPPKCPFCGHTFELKPRQVETVDGSLEEVNLEAMRKIKRTEQGRAQTLEELTELGRQRKMKNPRGWAYNVFQARQRRKVFG